MPESMQLSHEAISLLEQGRLIDAIKITRQQTGLDLKDSKALVEHYMAQHPHLKHRIAHPAIKPVKTTSTIGLVIILMVIIALVFWFIQ